MADHSPTCPCNPKGSQKKLATGRFPSGGRGPIKKIRKKL